jgi:hypothetical protein
MSARASAGSWLAAPSRRIEHNARPGYKIIVRDCESIEPRVLAYFSGCKAGERPDGLDRSGRRQGAKSRRSDPRHDL